MIEQSTVPSAAAAPVHAEMDMLDWLLLLAFDRGYSLAVGQAPLPVADAGIERMLATTESAWRARMGEPPVGPRPAWLEEQIATYDNAL